MLLFIQTLPFSHFVIGECLRWFTFDNKEAATLHLYYRLDPSLSIDEVISQLNTFEQINIKRQGDTLTID